MEQKSIFITGAASGIGRATATFFHQRGWFVGCYDVDLAGLQALEKELGSRCACSCLDVRDKEGFDAAMASFSEQTEGRLDIMFNNAGLAVGGNLDDVPFDKLMDMVNINLVGVLTGIYAAIPLLKGTENSLCFTTSSSSATFGSPGMATYAATKHAVKGLTEALSVELARYGSRASDVLPGIIDTPLWKSSLYAQGGVVSAVPNMPELNAARTDAGRTIAPLEVAECVWSAYHGDKLHWYVPPELVERDKAKVESPEAMRDELIAERAQ
jgi:NAD(P)-dependent dehydrogenase (short-subunit alcohol dehydrogenase family)